jgi:hypothetical protein
MAESRRLSIAVDKKGPPKRPFLFGNRANRSRPWAALASVAPAHGPSYRVDGGCAAAPVGVHLGESSVLPGDSTIWRKRSPWRGSGRRENTESTGQSQLSELSVLMSVRGRRVICCFKGRLGDWSGTLEHYL